MTGAPRAVLVAGGRGTRIRDLSGDRIPKALVPVAGEPIVCRQLRLLHRYGVREIAVLSGHRAELLRAGTLPLAVELGLRIEFFREARALGTAGGLPAAREFLRGSVFFVLYADVVLDIDLKRVLRFHRARGAATTIVAHPNDHPSDSDLLVCDGNDRVLKILSKDRRPPGDYPNLVPAAVYCSGERLFEYVVDDATQDFIRDVFPRMVESDAALYAYRTPEYLRDMGTPTRFVQAEEDLASGRVARLHFSSARPAVFFDRDGVINREVGGSGLIRAEELEILPGVPEALQRVNERGWLAILATNQPQVAKGFLTPQGLSAIHARLETLLGRHGAWFDRIYHCPHHPESGFEGEIPELKRRCDCRKPNAGMIFRALSELPISRAESCFIGDTWRDIGAAHEAGLYAYGVRTGFGCKGCRGAFRPDLMFSDVLEAVSFVLNASEEVSKLVGQIEEKVAMGRHPVVLGIAGVARSGKSTLAHGLVRALARRGISVLHVRLDDWIRPIQERVAGSPARDRCQVSLYRGILRELLAGDEVVVDAYDPYTRSRAGDVCYRLGNAPVLVLDGLFALDESLRDSLDIAVMVDMPDAVLVARFLEYGRWKGLDEASLRHLLSERLAEEWRAVRAQRRFSDVLIAPDVSGGPL